MDNEKIIEAEYKEVEEPSLETTEKNIRDYIKLHGKNMSNKNIHAQKIKDKNRLRKKLTLKMKRHTRNIGKSCR